MHQQLSSYTAGKCAYTAANMSHTAVTWAMNQSMDYTAVNV